MVNYLNLKKILNFKYALISIPSSINDDLLYLMTCLRFGLLLACSVGVI